MERVTNETTLERVIERLLEKLVLEHKNCNNGVCTNGKICECEYCQYIRKVYYPAKVKFHRDKQWSKKTGVIMMPEYDLFEMKLHYKRLLKK